MLTALCRMFGVSPEAMQGRMMLTPAQTGSVAQSIEQPVGELCVFLLSVIAAMVIFAVLWIIFKLIIRTVMPLFSLPGIHAADKVLGAVVGALEGAVLVVFLCNILYLLISCTNPALTENTTLFGPLFNTFVIFR